ncbi:alpha/beta fold hydrolase [Nonomuraea sp. NPDC048826]|uniref:alpha/beta fold hydrolase n=1 Tax=Nonomuraea sp. NPDC048826 TaxID=3364347 RepID=UPI00372447C6
MNDGEGIRHVRTADGVRLAYEVSGRGPALVRAPHSMSHLLMERTSPVWRHWLELMAGDRTLLRYDQRGSGLSDRDTEHGLGRWLGDLETVVDAAGLDRFTLLGAYQGGTVAVGYAARHPERVNGLVLYGTSARGRAHWAGCDPAEVALFERVTEIAWGRVGSAFRHVFADLLLPDASSELKKQLVAGMGQSADGREAARICAAWAPVDLTGAARRLRVPALVLHVLGDRLAPCEEGRSLAGLIPDSRFVALPGRNHLMLPEEPAWLRFSAEVRAFLGVPAQIGRGEAITGREREVLTLVMLGLGNEEIAARLFLSVRTVERHLSNVYAKLGLHGKSARAAAAAALAGRSGERR